MSADNWDKCPRCVSRDLAEIDALDAKVTTSYGSIPVDEFDALRTEAIDRREKHGSYDAFRTFREDYEIGGAEEGLIEVSYRGGCNVCGLRTEFEHSHPLDINGGTK